MYFSQNHVIVSFPKKSLIMNLMTLLVYYIKRADWFFVVWFFYPCSCLDMLVFLCYKGFFSIIAKSVDDADCDFEAFRISFRPHVNQTLWRRLRVAFLASWWSERWGWTWHICEYCKGHLNTFIQYYFVRGDRKSVV